MRMTALVLALAALPLATPSFAKAVRIHESPIEACNRIADAHGVTGRARISFVQECFESSFDDGIVARG